MPSHRSVRLTNPAGGPLPFGRGLLARCARIACIVALLSPPASVLAASTGSVLAVTEEAEQEFARHGTTVALTIEGRTTVRPASKTRAVRGLHRPRGDSPSGPPLQSGHCLANGLCAPLRC